jgi:hypothetical protein
MWSAAISVRPSAKPDIRRSLDSVPRYQFFIEPVLRYLAGCGTASTADVYEAAARALELAESDRQLRVRSGTLTYKNRAAWALNTLKHAGLVVAPKPGTWELTSTGREFAATNPELTESQVLRLVSMVPRGAQSASRQREASTSLAKQLSQGDRKAYRLRAQPISSGGQADVYEAERKSDGKIFVLKRVRGPSGQPRMRREIEVQSSLKHENVMPILDWDTSGFTWYVMPKGARVMSELTLPMKFETLLHIVDSVAAGLEVAHSSGHPHRDVKPHNIIELAEADGRTRWVLADWGLTRRPLGETVTPLTRTGQVLGTEGFAPPEAYQYAHEYGEPGDVFALGQVIAWAAGATPVPNVAGTAPEPWTRLVSDMTQLRPNERIQSITEVRSRLGQLRLAQGPTVQV